MLFFYGVNNNFLSLAKATLPLAVNLFIIPYFG